MTDYSVYYETRLYPLQDAVLKNLKSLELPFYLTGGTALSRGYYKHRYSDDLDLFVNGQNNFLEIAQKALDSLKNSELAVETETMSDSFLRLIVLGASADQQKNVLKIDFVNDVSAHFGDITETPVYYRTDSVRNILSNKYTALYRISTKDIVDIYEIARHCSFSWKEIIEEAEQKEAGINLREVSEIFRSYDTNSLSSINWIGKPDLNLIKAGIDKIAYDMMTMGENSLCQSNGLGNLIVSEPTPRKPKHRDSGWGW